MLVTVIIFLREALEAALILSVLLAVSCGLLPSRRWVVIALLIGLGGGAITAYFLSYITNLFDGTGQELMNASFLFMMSALNTGICIYLARCLQGQRTGTFDTHAFQLQTILMLTAAIAITHEGSELSLYSYAFAQTQSDIMPLVLGGILGLGIGTSLGAIIFYVFQAMSKKRLMLTAIAILNLISAGMTSQGVLYLIQSGWLPSHLPLWNTSVLISENSIVGQLLYALVGYEATPDPLQVIAYVGIIILNLVLMYFFTQNASLKKVTETP